MPKERIDKDAPDAATIRKQMRAQQTYYQKQADLNDKAHDMLHMAHLVEAPGRNADMVIDPYIYRSGRYPELIERLQGLLEVRAQYSIDPLGIGSTAEADAEERQRWANAVRWVIEREQGEQTNHYITQEVLNYGYTGVLVLPLPQAWKDWPKRDKEEEAGSYTKKKERFQSTAPVPIAVWHLSAQSWMPVIIGNKVIKSYNVKKCTAAYVLDRYDLEIPEIENPEEDVEICEFTDDTWHNVYVFHGQHFEQTVKTFKHRMPLKGQAPCVLIEGLTNSDPRPGYRWHGVLSHASPSVVAQDVILSRKMTMIKAFYLPTFDIYLSDPYSEEALTQARVNREYNLGGTNFFFPNEKKELNALPSQLPDSEEAYQYLDQRIDRVFPPALQGIINGQSSGYEYNQARTESQNWLRPIAERLAEGDADIMRLVFMAVGAVGKIVGEDEKIYVRERTNKGTKPLGLSWEDVRDVGTLVKADREVSLPPDELAQLDAAMKAYEFGLPWDECVKDYLHKPDPEKLRQQRASEELEKAEPLLARTTDLVMQKLGIITQEQQGMIPEQAQGMAPNLPPALLQAAGLQAPAPMMGPQVPPEMMAQIAGAGGPGAPPPMMMTPGGGEPPPGIAPPPPPTANPRAGTRTRPGGPRKKARSSSIPGRSA